MAVGGGDEGVNREKAERIQPEQLETVLEFQGPQIDTDCH